MALKLVTAPAIEPITLAEAKAHLRVDVYDPAEGLSAAIKLVPAAHAIADTSELAGLAGGPSADNELIAVLITAARQDCEAFQNRAYLTQTWELWLDAFPSKNYIELPRPPLQLPAVTAGSFVTGAVYRILSVGTTDFTLIGASANTVGVVFTATGAGSGTGTATASVIISYYDADDAVAYFAGSNYLADDRSEPGRLVLNSGKSWPSTTLRPANGVCITFIAGYSAAASVPESWKAAIKLLLGHLYENREAVIIGQTAAELPMAVERLLWKDRVFGP